MLERFSEYYELQACRADGRWLARSEQTNREAGVIAKIVSFILDELKALNDEF